jgi:hypothetical protein
MAIARRYLTVAEAAAAIGRSQEFIREHPQVFDLRRAGKVLLVPVTALETLPRADVEEAITRDCTAARAV